MRPASLSSGCRAYTSQRVFIQQLHAAGDRPCSLTVNPACCRYYGKSPSRHGANAIPRDASQTITLFARIFSISEAGSQPLNSCKLCSSSRPVLVIPKPSFSIPRYSACCCE
ncbi:hypothetical protein KCP74_06820 [Salmonella enterica subsp. enterica]|nr:hypothetical protein KCP74_06820 [Salmonella enterica subsp. enterica]